MLDVLPGAISCPVPLDVDLLRPGAAPARRRGSGSCSPADDRPRKGLRTLLDAYERIGRGPHADRFHLDLAGPAERHVQGLANGRLTLHGWLQPDALAELFRRCDVVVAPATADRPEDGEGDTGMVDGFPSTSVRSAMATGCLLVGSNPDRRRAARDRRARLRVRAGARSRGARGRPARACSTATGRGTRSRSAAPSACARAATPAVVVDRKLRAMGLA